MIATLELDRPATAAPQPTGDVRQWVTLSWVEWLRVTAWMSLRCTGLLLVDLSRTVPRRVQALVVLSGAACCWAVLMLGRALAL